MDMVPQTALLPAATASPAAASLAPSTGPQPAPTDSISRFETLMYTPGSDAAAASPAATGTQAHLRGALEGLSTQWRGLDQVIARLSKTPELTPKEMMSLQYEMVKASTTLELTSKSAGIVERDVQTLIQRS
jgi:hypothetical protein